MPILSLFSKELIGLPSWCLYKDENGNYLPPLSTKKKPREDTFQWLKEGIPQKQEKTTVQNLSLKNAAKKIHSESEARIIINELKQSGLVKTYTLNNTEQVENLISFLKTFWNWEKSPY